MDTACGVLGVPTSASDAWPVPIFELQCACAVDAVLTEEAGRTICAASVDAAALPLPMLAVQSADAGEPDAVLARVLSAAWPVPMAADQSRPSIARP